MVAEPIPGKVGKSPIDIDPKTGEVFVNVRVRIDQAKYTQFANEVVEKITPMAIKKFETQAYTDGRRRYDPYDKREHIHIDLVGTRKKGDEDFCQFFVMTSLRWTWGGQKPCLSEESKRFGKLSLNTDST